MEQRLPLSRAAIVAAAVAVAVAVPLLLLGGGSGEGTDPQGSGTPNAPGVNPSFGARRDGSGDHLPQGLRSRGNVGLDRRA